MNSKLENLTTTKMFEIQNLSIFAKISAINATTDITHIWKEQMEQLIEVDARGFYKGCEKEELVQSQEVFYKLLVSLKDRKENEEIGELPILNLIIQEVSNFLNAIMLQTSLNKAADHVQKIIHLINDFEVLVPRQFHFTEKIGIIECLSRWRKKERKMWRSMLSIQNLDMIIDDLIICIKFKQAVLSAVMKRPSANHTKEDEDKMTTTILQILEDFLRGGKFFSFVNRVAWTQLVLAYLYTLKRENLNIRSVTIMEQLVGFYGNWLNFALSQYRDMFTGIDKPIRDVEKLSNWHMKDFVNLKMNTNKYYRGLNRTMKRHTEILEQRTPIIVIEAKRNLMLFQDEQNLVTKLQEQGFDYQGEYEIYEMNDTQVEEDEVEKILEKVVNPYGMKRFMTKGEEDEQKVVKEIPKLIYKTLNKKNIEEFVETYTKEHPELESKVLNLLVKDLRLIEPSSWLVQFLPGLTETPTTRNEKCTCIADIIGNKNLKVTYNEYNTAVQTLEQDIDSWFSTLVEIQEAKSRSVRNRSMNEFLKLIKSYGFNPNTRIATFTSSKVFEKMTGVRNIFLDL